MVSHNGLSDLDIDVVGDDEEKFSDTGGKPSDTKGKEVNQHGIGLLLIRTDMERGDDFNGYSTCAQHVYLVEI